MIVKFNGGKLAMLCSTCRTIIKEGKDFTFEEKKIVLELKTSPERYCETCLNKKIKCN